MDRKSNVWVVEIDTSTLRRVKAVTGVNLLECVEGDLIERLSSDVLLLVDVLYAILQPHAINSKSPMNNSGKDSQAM